jgi:hypothetical protein
MNQEQPKTKFDISDALVLSGAIFIGIGLWLIYPPATFITIGAGLLALGLLGSR